MGRVESFEGVVSVLVPVEFIVTGLDKISSLEIFMQDRMIAAP